MTKSSIFLYSHQWASGFFDAEGHVGISRRVRSDRGLVNQITHELQINVTQKAVLPLEELKKVFGGRIANPSENYNCYRWHLYGPHAEYFLKTIRPWSLIKQRQIDLALKLRGFTKSAGGYRPNSKDDVMIRDSIWTDIKTANQDITNGGSLDGWNYSVGWIGGFFDGEGHVSIGRRINGTGKMPPAPRNAQWITHDLCIGITQKTISGLSKIKSLFGGYIQPPNKHSNCFKWRATGEIAERFLRDIRPNVLVKSKQVDLALQLRSFVGVSGHIVSNDTLAIRDGIRDAIMKANKERVLND